jgi:integration host factor subunit beta
MIKSKLIARIAEQNPHLFARDVKKVVDTILDEIAAALARRDRVELRGFGIFTVRTWLARPLGRNPKTGAPISIPETHHPTFRTGREMKARLNRTAGNALRAAFHTVPGGGAFQIRDGPGGQFSAEPAFTIFAVCSRN